MLIGTTFALVATMAGGAYATVGADVVDGVTEIFGNHFGRPGENDTYDYVIVGGGTAGNAVAARLAMDPRNYSVAVIQAGSFYEIMNGNLTQIPGLSFESAEPNFASGGLNSITAIGLETLPQIGYNNRTIPFIVGQTFGGGSAANTGGYHRNTRGTYDWWANITGDDYWKWDNVYPFFKKSANFTPPDYSKIDPALNISYDPTAYIPTGGPLHVSYGGFQGPYGPYLEAALAKMGFPALPGLNSGELIGYGTATAGIDPKTMTRDSSETSFLQAGIQASPRLMVYPDTLGTQVLFDENKKARGVALQANIRNNPVSYHLNATKEVIISGGVWFSPHLLMHSGIGPKDTLEKFNISVVVDNPAVGQNEWDSPYLTTVWKVNVTTQTQFINGNPEAVKKEYDDWTYRQAGRLSCIGTGQALSFEKYPPHLRAAFSQETLEWLATFPADFPETEYLPLEESDFPANISTTDNYMSMGSPLLAAKSVGNMTISSNNPFDLPVISPNWLLDVADQEMAVASVKRIREIAGNSSMFLEEYSPGPSVATDVEILAWLKENMNLIYHGSATCRMGSANETNSVLDSRARVKGVTGLRVVDASAYPLLPPGHTMGSVYMYAEAISHSILTGDQPV